MSRVLRRREDAGAAALLVVVLASLLTVLALTAGVLGGVLAGHRRAAAAADLAALAGAVAVQHGRDGCPEAREVAGRNGAELRECRVEGERVRVEASVDRRLPAVGVVELRATGYAGPVEGG